MKALDYLKDNEFLRALDNENNKFYWVKIEVLDSDEYPISSIEGRVQSGSTISINGSSSVRRTCTINFIATEEENDLTDVDNLLSINKKIKIFEGLKNNINSYYEDIVWLPLGVYVITQPSISHNADGCVISLSCKDKMCLLNGECAGGLPTSVTFDSYDQVIGLIEVDNDPMYLDIEPNDYTVYKYAASGVIKYKTWTRDNGWKEEENADSVGKIVSRPQRIYDIIQTLVCNYGGESLSKIFINDIPLELKQIVRYTGDSTLYYNSATGFYTTDSSYINDDSDTWNSYEYNEDVGYIYTDFIYPGQLVSGINENIVSVLDKIKNTLGNYEYFYDLEGNFVFQEIKNYLNTSYDPTDVYRLDNNRKIELASNGLSVLDDTNYEVDFYSNRKSVYTFSEGNGLITSTSNSPNYMNIKNDFHIWGSDTEGYAIHYHFAIKRKPTIMNTYSVVYIIENDEYTGGIRLANDGEAGVDYIPTDWRAEIYLQGLTKQKNQIRPDIYEQELLDLFDSIYDFKERKFKEDIVLNPNNLKYFFDYLEPVGKIYDCSIDSLNSKIYSFEEKKINKIYNMDIPNLILISLGRDSISRAKIIERCEREGQPYSNVDKGIYANLSIGTTGYSAEDTARELLYQYTNYKENISLQTIPVYYLDVNSRITVQDKKAGIYGDYIINSISLPLDAGGQMTISATRALERI